MRVLRVAGLRRLRTWTGCRPVQLRRGSEVCLAELPLENFTRLEGRALRHSRAVRPHVRDETDRSLVLAQLDAFVEILRQAHGALGAKTEFFRRFLLQGGRSEGRGRILPPLPALDVGYGEDA